MRILLMVFITFLFAVFVTPFVKKIALHIGAVDLPNDRKVHKKPMPRLGGLAIYFGFLLGYMLFGTHSETMNSILIGSFIIVLTGVTDDVKPLKASYKFIGQLVASCIIVFYGNILLKDISAFGLYFDFGTLAYPITIFFILGCINCMNLIDGLDGLASGISSIYFLTIGIIATMQGKNGLDFVLTFIMLGSTLGFLVHNFNPASIFMGDSGSMFLGFIIAIIALLGFKNVTMTSLIIPLLILAIPILDTIFAIIRRTLKGESISTPDRFHIHHQLLNHNFSQRATVLMIYGINLLFAAASIVYVLKDQMLGYIIYGILLIIVILFVVKTNIVFDGEEIKKKIFRKTNRNKK
ncbi:MAG: undecaprenyl/decaprenyl-phosphate alpha-N-acetylglucosaminyl 1-phosphate transferase [Bacilli bacterium]|nr:undecaprenyl/decaprenyl-phosphate alpha-N-acetylglucosaminyl 1-phosphate transferase [Bacilli bacterium]